MDQIPLGTEVGLGSGDIVFDGDPAAPTERDTAVTAVPPYFGPLCSESTATYPRRCRIFNDEFITNLLTSETIKELRKSVIVA